MDGDAMMHEGIAQSPDAYMVWLWQQWQPISLRLMEGPAACIFSGGSDATIDDFDPNPEIVLLQAMEQSEFQLWGTLDSELTLEASAHIRRHAIDEVRGYLHDFLTDGDSFLAMVGSEPSPPVVPGTWSSVRPLVIAEIRQAVAQARVLFCAPVPSDPSDAYRAVGTLSARLLAGLADVWDRLEDTRTFYEQFDIPVAFDDEQVRLVTSWMRLSSAFDDTDARAAALWSADVHETLALLVRRLATWAQQAHDGVRELFEAWGEDPADFVPFWETVVGLAKASYKLARELAFDTVDVGRLPTGWENVPDFPSLSAFRERLANRSRVGGRLDSS